MDGMRSACSIAAGLLQAPLADRMEECKDCASPVIVDLNECSNYRECSNHRHTLRLNWPGGQLALLVGELQLAGVSGSHPTLVSLGAGEKPMSKAVVNAARPRLTSSSGMSVELNTNGTLRRFDCGPV